MGLKHLNIPPYFDDFDQTKNYMRVLFRPAVAVQVRELTQLQTALQAQIDRFGRHIFKEGSSVLGGMAALDSQFAYVKLESSFTYLSTTYYPEGDGGSIPPYYSELIGTVLTGQTTGVQARVLDVVRSNVSDPLTAFVKYTSAGTDNASSAFAPTEILLSNGTTPRRVKVKDSGSDPTGFGCRVSVTEGVFFVAGNFVYSPAGSVILSKYSPKASARVVYIISENIVSSADDATLTDNALGTPNIAAPGADRYQIELTLAKQDISFANRDEDNIIQLLVVEDGKVREEARTQYSEIGDILAQRTFEESGNYTVRPFQINIREYLNTGSNGGVYTAQQILDNDRTGTLSTLLDAENYGAAKIAVGLEPSVAYVNGYRIQTVDTKYIAVDRARDEGYFNGATVLGSLGSYINVTNIVGLPDVNTFVTINLKDVSNATIGTARARALTSNGLATGRLYLFDISMNAGQSFTSVRHLQSTLGSGPAFTADCADPLLLDTGNNSMVFPLPVGTVKTLRATGGLNDTFYEVIKKYDNRTTNGAGVVTITATTNEIFTSTNVSDWMSVTNTGTVVYPNSVVLGGSPAGSSATLTFSGSPSTAMYILAPSRRNLFEKTKNIHRNFNIAISSPNTTPGNFDSLGVTDVLKIDAIYMSPGMGTAATTAHTNVTSRYVLDSGQRDNFYDAARIKLRNDSPAPTGQLLVVVDYFSHGAGDYFTVDSYVDVDYSEIPAFQSNRGVIQLRDAIDFRPTKANSGADFTSTGASVTSTIKPGSIITCDIQYYMPRIDKIYVDKGGNFGVVNGISSNNPVPPDDPKDAMVLYVVGMTAYTFSPADVVPSIVDNKRYTMRDIGKIEKRVGKLEYYTSLSLLEQTAANSQVLDSTSGLQRYKNGFIVDNFYGSNIAAVTSSDFKASMDKSSGTLRPMFYEDNARLIWNSGASSGLRKTGSLLTLDYYQADYIKQPYASTAQFVNPYNVFSWTGSLQLSPTTDEWKETKRAPDVVIDQTGIYDALVSMLDSQGAIGTVWNEWQTNWTGVSSSTDNSNVYTPTESLQLGFQTVVTTTTTTTTTSQARSGLSKSVVPDTVSTNIGDRVVEVNFVPFIRSRKIYFNVTGMKPNTQVYAFFDGQSVADYVRTESSFVEYSASTDVSNYFNRTGHPDGATTLVTDASGNLTGSFVIPNTSVLKFKTGSRIFRLTDSSSNAEAPACTTWAEATYVAQGVLQTLENQVISTAVPVIKTSQISDTRVIVDSTSSTTSANLVLQSPPNNPGTSAVSSVSSQPGGAASEPSSAAPRFNWVQSQWWAGRAPVNYLDPVAQTFLVDIQGGAFLTSIDLYFKDKDPNLPVTVQLRTVENGQPTHVILPFSEVTLPASYINVSDDASAVTSFVFKAPIHVIQGVEYCFVVMSNSDKVKLWVSEVGQYDVTNPAYRITAQPYAGVFFESSNASTWTPDQTKDIKFNIRRAVFSQDPATAVFNEADLPATDLDNDPIQTTNASNTVRIYHRHHGLFAGSSQVTISGVVATSGADLNGIPIAQINGTHTVSSVEADSYTIVTASSATSTGRAGGSAVTSTGNLLYDILNPIVQQIILPDTQLDWQAKITSGKSLAGSEVPHTVSSPFNIKVNDNTQLNYPAVITAAPSYSLLSSGSRSFILQGVFSTSRNNISPVIDLDRLSLITVSNRIDNPAGAPASGYNTVSNFVAESVGVGNSALARYITRRVDLNDPATAIQIYVNMNVPPSASVEVWWKALPKGSDANFDLLSWTQATPANSIPVTDDPTDYTEVSYPIEEAAIGYEFSAMAVKIVLKSSNSSRVPTCRDFRALAVT